MKKKLFTRIAAVALASTMALSGAVAFGTYANAKDNTVAQNLKIAVMSDTHYLSPDLIKDTEDYKTDLNSDRKIFTESSAILNEMLGTVKNQNANVLLITGDITKDGELECHKDVADALNQLKSQMPGLKVYIVPGNHDIRNSNGKNFNTEDNRAIAATRTEPEDFINTYSDIYNDESVIARYTPPAGEEAGSLSYVARPADGYTIIAIDSARYSADNTDSGEDEHETSGQISASLEAWVLEQIADAKERGDTIIGMEHHGMVEHFTMEPDLLPMYLVNDYERISTEFADAGMNYIFTGHMHANDVAELTTDASNKLIDIETGSALTYPCPQRFITISRVANGNDITETMNCETVKDLGPITFTNPLTGKSETISNLTDYAQQHGFSEEMLSTTASGFLKDYFSKVLPTDLYPTIADTLIQNIVHDAAVISVTNGKTLLEYANYIYQCHLAGEDNGKHPAWVNAARENVANGTVLDAILKDVLIKNLCELPSTVANQILGGILSFATDNLKSELLTSLSQTLLNEDVDVAEKLAPSIFDGINNLLLNIIDSMSNDTNFIEDNNFTITRSFVSPVEIRGNESITNTNDYLNISDNAPLADTQTNTQNNLSANVESIVNTGDSSTVIISLLVVLSSAGSLIAVSKKK